MDKLTKKLSQYHLPVYIQPCEEGGYFATCPSLPGCFVEAETIPQTIEYLEDTIEKFIQSYQKHGDPLPEEIKNLQSEKDKQYFPISLFLPIRLAA